MDRLDFSERGARQNQVEKAQFEERRIRKVIEDNVRTQDVYVVKRYDHLANTVDVVHKMDPNHIAVQNVPVKGMGGSLRTYYGFRTIDNKDTEPDVGHLVFAKTDSATAFNDFVRRKPPSANIFTPSGCVFEPALPVKTQTNPPNVVATGPGKATEVAPGDKALIDPETGAGIIIKKGTGRVVIVGSIYLLAPGEDYGDATGVSLGGGIADSASLTTRSS